MYNISIKSFFICKIHFHILCEKSIDRVLHKIKKNDRWIYTRRYIYELALGCCRRSESQMDGRYKHDRIMPQVKSSTSVWRSEIIYERSTSCSTLFTIQGLGWTPLIVEKNDGLMRLTFNQLNYLVPTRRIINCFFKIIRLII